MSDQVHAAVDWPLAIGYHVLVRQRQGELLGGARSPFVPPRAGASEEAIAAVEARYGPLEATYRSFLAHVNGWENFHHEAALLGTDALLNPALEADVARYLEECEIEPEELDAGEVLALTTQFQGGVELAGRAGSAMAGQVMWHCRGQEVERYPRFADYFAARTEYEELALERAGHPRVAPRAGYDDLGDLAGSADRREQVAIARTVVATPAASWAMVSLVGCLAALKTELAQRGAGAVWVRALTAVGASTEQVAQVLALYGLARLDTWHGELLRAVDGWQHALLSFDLLSTDQLQDAKVMRPTVAHARTVLSANALEANRYLVVATSTDSDDTLVVGEAERVLWLRGTEQIVATYTNLKHWMISAITHHLTQLETTPAVLHSPLT